MDRIARRLGHGFQLRASIFDQLGLRDLPESYLRSHSGWLEITPPPTYVSGMDVRRRRFTRDFGRASPQPSDTRPSVEILLAPSGLGIIRLAQGVEWRSEDDLRSLHASQTPFAHSYFKETARDRHLSDDLLSLLPPICEAVITLPGATIDARYQLTAQLGRAPSVDFFVGLVTCSATSSAPDPPRWDELLKAREIECVTGRRGSLKASSVLSCGGLLSVGWDESLLAFPTAPSSARDEHQRNMVQLFTLAVMHWAGLYDADQLLYDAMPVLFEKGHEYTKLQLIRGVQAHLAKLQHESKVSYLAEHEDDLKVLSEMFAAWETEDLVRNLEKKGVILMGIVDRLNDERLRDVGVIFTVLSLVGVVSNLGQHRSWDGMGWLWSAVALAVAAVGWIGYRHFSRR